MTMDLHQASRTAALAFSIWTAWKVWAPPHALVSKDEQPQTTTEERSVKPKTAPAHTGWEVGLTPFMWRLLFGFSITCQTIFQIYVFQHYAGGLRTFSKVEWSTIDILALLCMVYAAKLRTDAYRTLGKYFTYKVHFTKEQELITEAPYTYLMHPGYLALLLHILPFLYFIGLKYDLRVLALYTVIGLVPFTRRILDEERALEKHFGTKAYQAYKSQRWHLIPFIW